MNTNPFSKKDSSSKNIEEEELEDEGSVKPGSYVGGRLPDNKSSAITDKTISEPNEGFKIDVDRQRTGQPLPGGPNRPKSKLSDASKYSAVVFTVPVEKLPKEPAKASEVTDEEDEEYEDDFEDEFEPYETSNEDQRTDMNGKSNTSAPVAKEEPQPPEQVHNQSAVNIEVQRHDSQESPAEGRAAR